MDRQYEGRCGRTDCTANCGMCDRKTKFTPACDLEHGYTVGNYHYPREYLESHAKSCDMDVERYVAIWESLGIAPDARPLYTEEEIRVADSYRIRKERQNGDSRV